MGNRQRQSRNNELDCSHWLRAECNWFPFSCCAAPLNDQSEKRFYQTLNQMLARDDESGPKPFRLLQTSKSDFECAFARQSCLFIHDRLYTNSTTTTYYYICIRNYSHLTYYSSVKRGINVSLSMPGKMLRPIIITAENQRIVRLLMASLACSSLWCRLMAVEKPFCYDAKATCRVVQCSWINHCVKRGTYIRRREWSACWRWAVRRYWRYISKRPSPCG